MALRAGGDALGEGLWVRAEARGLLSPPAHRFSTHRVLITELTRRCNLRCAHCGFGYGGSSGDLDLDLHDRVTAASAVPLDLVLSGGEPLLHPRVETFLQLSLERAGKVTLVTNGTVWRPKPLRQLAEGGGTLVISLDGAGAECHDNIRGPGAFGRAVRTAEAFRALSPCLELSFTLHRGNVSEILGMFALARRLGAAVLNVRALYGPPGSACEDMALDQVAHTETWKQIIDLAVAHLGAIRIKNVELMFDNVRFGQRQPCGAGRDLFFLHADGRLAPCRYLSATHSVMLDPAVVTRVVAGTIPFPRSVLAYPNPCRSCEWQAICAGGCLAQSCALEGTQGYCYREIYQYTLRKCLRNEVV